MSTQSRNKLKVHLFKIFTTFNDNSPLILIITMQKNPQKIFIIMEVLHIIMYLYIV